MQFLTDITNFRQTFDKQLLVLNFDLTLTFSRNRAIKSFIMHYWAIFFRHKENFLAFSESQNSRRHVSAFFSYDATGMSRNHCFSGGYRRRLIFTVYVLLRNLVSGAVAETFNLMYTRVLNVYSL